MALVPYVIEQSSRGERSFDIYSRLLEDRIVMLNEEVNSASASVVVAQLLYLESKDPTKDISLYINSPGGSVTDGFAIFDTMNYIKCDVSTICMGMAASMGAFLLAGGTPGKRLALPHSTIMIHQPSGGAQGQATEIQIVADRIQYTKRMRDEVGAKFQLVGHKIPNADYEGVISVENDVSGYPDGVLGMGAFGLVYWMTGAEAGCEVNRSCTNKQYDGELTVNTDYTQKQLEDAIKGGKLILHNANGVVRILDDINTLLTLTDTKGEVFQANQTIRVCDQIANDTAVLFNTRYLGVVPNDASGRMSLWADICKLIQELERLRAVEDFDTSTLTVEQGDTKKAVVATLQNLNIVNAMAQLYMSVIIM